MQPSHNAEIFVSKLAAAERQLREATRMFFDERDELAIHSVASAAYRLIADLKKKRGREEAADVRWTAVFYAVRDYRRGTLPSYMSDDPKMMQAIRDWDKQVPAHATESFEESSVRTTKADIKKFWDERNKVANFLKHADSDSTAHLPMEEVDNLDLLSQAHASYSVLSGKVIWPEGWVLWLYFSVVRELVEGLPEWETEVARMLERLSANDRLSLCSQLVNDFEDT